MDETIPTGITANRATREVTLTWSDGHKSVYSFALLRKACPCAECRGGHAQMRPDPDPAIFDLPEEDTPASRLRDLKRVGLYGLTPIWEDGHEYGIYNWGYLRKLCPCPECRAET